MIYRTKTYIAADWTEDIEVVKELRKYNDSNYYNLTFTDAHDLMQASDYSLPCSIKQSLRERMDRSKTFVLVVGEHTKALRKGNCYLCNKYIDCVSVGRSISNRSFIEYECDKAIRDELKIVVLYNATYRMYSKCPDVVANTGTHIPAYYYDNQGNRRFNYSEVLNTL